MPILGGDRRTLWIIVGIFLLFSGLIVTITEVALPAALIYPAAYCLYAERVQSRLSVLVACLPLLLALYPSFSFGASIYAVLLVSSLMMYHFLKRGSIGLCVAAPSFLVFVFIATVIFSLSHNSGIHVEQVVSRWAADVASEMNRVSASALSSSELLEFKEKLPVFQERIVALFPSIVLTSAAVIFWINLLIMKRRFNAIPLREWKSPEWVIVFFIIAGLLTLIPQKLLQALGLNLLIIVGQVYFFQGLAIMSVFMQERQWPGMIRWPIYILILIQIYIMIIVAGFGLFDAWFDFRKMIRTPKGDIQ